MFCLKLISNRLERPTIYTTLPKLAPGVAGTTASPQDLGPYLDRSLLRNFEHWDTRRELADACGLGTIN
jgi:hypothetical protein